MEKIKDSALIKKYQEKYDLFKLFGQDMSSFMELFMFKKQELICTQEEELDYFFLFVEGNAKVYSLQKNGKILAYRMYHPFKIIGDVELMLDTKISSSIQAVTNVYCIGIKMSIVKEKCMQSPDFLRYISTSLANKLVTFSKRSSINQLYSLENKLAIFIIRNTTKSSDLSNPIFQINLLQLSELLGTSYRHLLRTLSKLVSKGILKKHKSFFEILDSRALEELSSDV